MKTGDPSFIIPFTALGGPIVSVPVAIAHQGLPLGLMLIGAPGTDRALSRSSPSVWRALIELAAIVSTHARVLACSDDFPTGGKVDLEEILI